MYCSRCGGYMPDNSTCCPKCGAGIAPCGLGWQGQYGPKMRGQRGTKAFAAFIAVVVSLIVLALIFVLLSALGVIKLGAKEEQAPESSAAYTAGASPSLPAQTTEPQEEAYIDDISDEELLDYFCEVALNAEYGGESSNGIIRRWEQPIRVEVSGQYTNVDYATLEEHIGALNELGSLPDISFVDNGGNFFVYFVPLEQMAETIPGYVEDNWGYFYTYWSDFEITEAYMGIATDATSQSSRNHLILEEFTQALGLMNDSYKYPDSIFQAEWTQTQSLADIDYALLSLLYDDSLETGMGEYETRDILSARLAAD